MRHNFHEIEQFPFRIQQWIKCYKRELTSKTKKITEA